MRDTPTLLLLFRIRARGDVFELIDSRFVCNYTRLAEALYHRGKEGERKEEGDGRGRERKAGREEKKEKRNGNEGEPVIPIPFKTLLTREYTLCVYVSSFFFLFFVFSLYNKKPKVFFKDEFNLSGMDGLVQRSF